MNMLQPKSKMGAPRKLDHSLSKLEVRHLIFDMCASHGLNANGVFHVARQLAAEQSAAGDSAKVVLLRAPERGVPSDSTATIQVLPITGLKVRGHRLSVDARVLDAITAPGDGRLFIHMHAGREPLLLPVMLRLRKLGIPYAMTIHGRYSHLFDNSGRPTRQLPLLYLKHVERHVLEGAHFVQAVTLAESAIIKRIAPRARVVLISNAAYSSRFDGEPRALERVSPSPNFPVFGFLGRYEIEHKGLDLLVDGFAAYRQAGGKGRLELVGTGPKRDVVSALASERNVAEHVTVDGPRFGDEKARLLAQWDYFVAPSRFDVAPTGPLQGAFAGLPLIVSAETGLREEVQSFGAGVGIEQLDAGAIGKALLKAERCSAAEWAAMSTAARRMSVAIGDWTAVAAKLASLYRGA